ncbi:MAG: ExeM/NucH family extracellular endonuclease [Pelomonas sp.]|nr:ExeM/NucH family extracellular endonuclease [Roseateles sp.]
MKLKLLAALLGAAFGAHAMASTSGVVISQLYGGGGNSGAPLQNDFVELFNAGTASVDISGWSIQYTSAAGTTWGSNKLAIPSGTTIAAGQYYLIKLAAGTAGSAFTGDLTGTINMSATAGKVALVNNNAALSAVAAPTDASIVDIVSFGSATPTEGSPAPTLSNTLAAIRAGAGCTDTDANASDFTTGTPAPRNSSAPLHSCSSAPINQPITPSCPDQSFVSGTAANFSVSATDPDSAVNSASVSSTLPTGVVAGSFAAASGNGGAATQAFSVAASLPVGSYPITMNWGNNDGQTASCTFKLVVAGLVTIPQIQGKGARSPLEGQNVTTTGVVTLKMNAGFFLQDPIGDNDPSTSDGIYVYTGTAPTVNVGDAVSVSAKVQEYSVGTGAASLAAPMTELSTITNITVLSSGNALPAPVEVDLNVENGNLERFEGMLVTLRGPLTVQQNAFLGDYGQLTLTAGTDRLQQSTNIMRPGAEANALTAANLARTIVLDDASTLSQPNPTPYLEADHSVRAGDQTDAVTGVIDFGYSSTSSSGLVSYKIEPIATPVFTRVNDRATQPDPVGGNVRVASANIANFFTTFTDGTTFDGQTSQGCTVGSSTSKGNCRGADSLAEFTRQRTKVLAELSALDADVLGLMEVQNNGDITAQNLVDGLNAIKGAGTYALVPYPPQGTGTDAIRVAMLYKPGHVSLAGPSLSNADPINNRAPFAQGFMTPNGQRFAFVVNHLRSKGSCPSSGANADLGDQQGCWNATRVQQAQNLLSWLPTVEAAAGTQDVVMVGDFNAYAMEDPMYALTSSGSVVNLVSLFDAADYSYVYDAQAGRLDQGLGTPSIAPKVTGARSWHINADEPAVLDYNLDGKSVDYYTPTPYRASDHDPLVIGLNLVNSITGTSGRDTIVGTDGDDIIEGGPGADTLTGGKGNNQFVYRNLSDAGDVITDFVPGKDLLVFGPLLQNLHITSTDPYGQGYVTCTQQAAGAVIGVDQDAAGPVPSRAMVQLKGVSCSSISAANFKF